MNNIAKSKTMTADGGDTVGNVGVGGWMVKYRERRYLPGKASVLSSVTRLRREVDIGANERSLQVPGCHRAGNIMVTATGKSYGAPPPGI